MDAGVLNIVEICQDQLSFPAMEVTSSPHVRVSKAYLVCNPCLRAEVVNEFRLSSTIEVENVNGSQSISVVWEIPCRRSS